MRKIAFNNSTIYRLCYLALALMLALVSFMLIISRNGYMSKALASTQGQNVIMIQVDHELFYQAGYSSVLRPSYDEFLQTATSFTNAVSVCPLCSPARQSVITGLYPQQHGILNNSEELSPFNVENVFDVINNAGNIENYFIGKWHASGGIAKPDGVKANPSELYGTKGFTLYGYNNPYLSGEYKAYWNQRKAGWEQQTGRSFTHNEPYMIMYDNDKHDAIVGRDLLLATEYSTNLTGTRYGILQTHKESHEAFFVANEANNALTELASSKKQFAMQVNIWGPHHPYQPTQEFVDLYTDANGKIGGNIPMYPSFKDTFENKPQQIAWDEAYWTNGNPAYLDGPQLFGYATAEEAWSEVWQQRMGIAYASVTLVDQAVGTILRTLKETGLDQNTVVIWTADHGDALGSHGGHMDKQCYQTEEINRIPMAVRVPGGKQQVNNELVNTLDVPATLLDAVGLNFSEEVYGKSMLPFARGETVEWRDYTVSVTNGHFTNQQTRSVYWDKYKYNYSVGDIDELYDLENDPFEMTNLIYQPKYYNIILEMKKMCLEWQIETGDIVSYVNI